jgi:hypothetical protein
MRSNLSSKCTRSTAEFGIVFVITVVSFDDECAIGKVLVVCTIGWYMQACKNITKIRMMSQKCAKNLLTFNTNHFSCKCLTVFVSCNASVVSWIEGLCVHNNELIWFWKVSSKLGFRFTLMIIIQFSPGISILSDGSIGLLSLYHVISGVGSPVTLHLRLISAPTLNVLPFGSIMLAVTGTECAIR